MLPQIWMAVKSILGLINFSEFCSDRQLSNVDVIVADISNYDMEGSFDRIFSIEMFEVKNALNLHLRFEGSL